MSKDAISLTAADLRVLHGRACEAGTLDRWSFLALQMVEAFDAEIKRLNQELSSLKEKGV